MTNSTPIQPHKFFLERSLTTKGKSLKVSIEIEGSGKESVRTSLKRTLDEAILAIEEDSAKRREIEIEAKKPKLLNNDLRYTIQPDDFLSYSKFYPGIFIGYSRALELINNTGRIDILIYIAKNLIIESDASSQIIIMDIIRWNPSSFVMAFIPILIQNNPTIDAFIKNGMNEDVAELIGSYTYTKDMIFLFEKCGVMTTKLNLDLAKTIISKRVGLESVNGTPIYPLVIKGRCTIIKQMILNMRDVLAANGSYDSILANLTREVDSNDDFSSTQKKDIFGTIMEVSGMISVSIKA